MKTESSIFAEIIPVILILQFALYPKLMVTIAHTYLGRFISIALRVWYTSVNVLYGLFMCLMVILFYQLDYVESFTSVKDSKSTVDSLTESRPKNSVKDVGVWNILEENMDSKPEQVGVGVDVDVNVESFSEYTNVSAGSGVNSSANEFRSKNCKNSQLVYKEFPIKTEMAQHVFPEIVYEGEVCNLCDPNCAFSVSLNKIKTEEDVVKPKNSNDWAISVWSKLWASEETKPELPSPRPSQSSKVSESFLEWN